MALSLKTSGVATALEMCLAVDDDGTTIREFVSTDVNTNKTLGTGVTASANSWKGVSRGYFPTLANGAFDYHGVRFASGHRPAVDFGNTHPASFFAAFRGMSTAQNIGAIMEALSSGNSQVGRNGASGALIDRTGSYVGNTNMPTDSTTAFSVGEVHNYGATFKFFYGLESGNLAADGTTFDGLGFGSDSTPILGIGGATGQGNQPSSVHVACYFNRELTLGEFQSLHDDWFGTLFDSPSGVALIGQATL